MVLCPRFWDWRFRQSPAESPELCVVSTEGYPAIASGQCPGWAELSRRPSSSGVLIPVTLFKWSSILQGLSPQPANLDSLTQRLGSKRASADPGKSLTRPCDAFTVSVPSHSVGQSKSQDWPVTQEGENSRLHLEKGGRNGNVILLQKGEDRERSDSLEATVREWWFATCTETKI